MENNIKINKDNYLSTQWDFYLSEGLELYYHQKLSNICFTDTPTQIPSKDYLKINSKEDFINLNKEKDKYTITLHLRKGLFSSHNYFKHEKFLEHYITNCEYQDKVEIFSNKSVFFEQYRNTSHQNYVKSLLSSSLEKKDTIKILLSYSNRDFPCDIETVNKINDYLNHISTDTKNDFFYKFFKKRASAINKPVLNLYIADFIDKSCKDENLIEKYKVFFPYLSELKKDNSDLNIFSDNEDYQSFIFSFNTRIIHKKYPIFGASIPSFTHYSGQIFDSIENHYGLKSNDMLTRIVDGNEVHTCVITHNTDMNVKKYKSIYVNILENLTNYTSDEITNQLIDKIVEHDKISSSIKTIDANQKRPKL